MPFKISVMKYFNHYTIIVAAVLLGFVSCKKDFLQEDPYSFISSDDIYNTATGAEAAMLGCYGYAANYGGFGAGYGTLMHVTSGGFYTSQGPAASLNNLSFNSTEATWINNNSCWNAFYKSIAIANDIIEKLPEGQAPDSTKKRIVGEAKFMRGMLYFNLVRMFGGVPLRLAPVTVNETNMARATKEEVYTQIISDLEFAKANMVEPGKQAVGRPHKFAASALLGKVYITLASNTPGSANWQKAKDELLTVVNSGAYSLETNFVRLFDINNENNRESIFEVQFSITQTGETANASAWTNFYSPNGSTFTPLAANGPFGRNRVNKEIYDRHVAQYTVADPRIDAVYIDSFFVTNAGATTRVYPWNNNANNARSQGWPYLKKYVDPQFVSNVSNRNFIYLRYADVLLMLAEAENEINGPAAAYQYVNQVLTRARRRPDGTNAAQPANWTVANVVTQDHFRDRIFLERRYELIGECHLWYDVRRRGKAYFKAFLTSHNTHPTFNTTADVLYPVDDNSVRRLLLLPIPANEVNANTLIGDADQNFGY